jgi:hypothetical protein
MSGCAALGVDTNADPSAMSASGPQASADLTGSVDRSVSASPRIARPISVAKTVPSSYAVPSYYVEKSCKAVRGTDESDSHESCVQQEVAAKDKVTKDWKGYTAEALNDCVPATHDPANSYVELMTCFEMLDWIKNPASIGGVTGTGAMHAGNMPAQPSELQGGSADQASSAVETPAAAEH